MNTPLKNCTECGAELAAGAVRGLCPRCLLQAGLGSQTDPNATVVAAGGAGQQRVLPNAGDLFGPYRIIRLLGRGGMGVVYEAEEQETGRRVALKVLARQFDSAKDRARFLREGRMAASINHPNSVYVFGTEEINGTPTIAMELVSGGTLQERLKERGPMSVPAAVDAILQIIAGLEAAQAIGILAPRRQAGQLLRGRRRHDQDRRLRPLDFHGMPVRRTASPRRAHWSERQRSARRNSSAARSSVPARTCIRWAGRCSSC